MLYYNLLSRSVMMYYGNHQFVEVNTSGAATDTRRHMGSCKMNQNHGGTGNSDEQIVWKDVDCVMRKPGEFEKPTISQTEYLQNLLSYVSGHGGRKRCIEHVQKLTFEHAYISGITTTAWRP